MCNVDTEHTDTCAGRYSEGMRRGCILTAQEVLVAAVAEADLVQVAMVHSFSNGLPNQIPV